MDMLAQAEVQLQVDFLEDDGWLVVEDFQFDFPKANKLMTNAMKILGMANVQTGQARHSMLASKFKQEFRRLCDRSNNFEEGMFFGPSLDSATTLVTDANKIQTKAFEQKTFHGRGSHKWGRNRSSTSPGCNTTTIKPTSIWHHKWGNFRHKPVSTTTSSTDGTQHPFDSLPPRQRKRPKEGLQRQGQGKPQYVSIPYPDIPVGGQIQYFAENWSNITSDNYILSMVEGLQLNLTEFPQQDTVPPLSNLHPRRIRPLTN